MSTQITETNEIPAIHTTEQETTMMLKLPRKKKAKTATKGKKVGMGLGPVEHGTELSTHLNDEASWAAEKAKMAADAEAVSEAGSENLAEETPPEVSEAAEMEQHDTAANAVADEMMAGAVTEDAAPAAQPAPKGKAPPTVMVTLPFKGQSVAFIEVMIGSKTGWLAKSSLTSFEVEDGQVMLELPRALARRRGLLAA